MRAIIISEVFTKALRRRDLSGETSTESTSTSDKGIEKSNSNSKDQTDTKETKPKAVEANVTNLVGVDAFFICKQASLGQRLR